MLSPVLTAAILRSCGRECVATIPGQGWFLAVAYKRRPCFLRPSTARYRGYVAKWEISEGKIYLIGIEGHLARGRKEVTYVPADLPTPFPG
jgi:hypothetical protein